MLGLGKLGLAPGQWASDTAMALALLDSLRCRRGLDETDLMERFLDWQEDGAYSCTLSCVGIGDTTKEALARYKQTDDPIAAYAYSASLANDSLVRVAPVAVRYWNDRSALLDVAARQSRATHAAVPATESSVAFAEVLADAIAGAGRAVVLGPRDVLKSSAIGPMLAGSWKTKKRSEIDSGDNVMKSLEAALWCVDRTFMFDEAVLRAANLGGDAGSTAALAGALAGALYGASAIPPGWSKRVAWSDQIVKNVDALFHQGILPEPRT
jgi:ADP-ribosyl-[dinitrogen reductase] hydrolase